MLRRSADGSAGHVPQLEVILMSRPVQAERPAPRCGEVNDRQTRAAGNFSRHSLAGAVERGTDPQRSSVGAQLRDPKDLITPASERRCMQWVVIGPENGDDVSPCAHHIWHRLRWRTEPGACPGGKRARGYRGGAVPCRRRDCARARGRAGGLGWWLRGTRCMTGRAPGSRQDDEQDQSCAPPHMPSVRPGVIMSIPAQATSR
jgi:hypothetical protein